MGFRNYLGKIPKKDYIEIKDKSYEELLDYFNVKDYFNPRDIPSFVNLYELGKYCEFDYSKDTSNFFTNIEADSDEMFLLASKDFLLNVIEDYRKYVISYYDKLSKGETETSIEKFIINRKNRWEGQWIPYDINDNCKLIVSSWEYEYAIFELVRIYKDFDWDNDLLIYLGY